MIPISELDLIKIGEIIKTHGYKGELIIKLSINFKRLKKTELLFFEIKGNIVPFFFDTAPKSYKKSGLIAKFENLNSDEEVEKLLNTNIFITKDKLEEEESILNENIEGFYVYDNDVLIGTVTEYLNIPSNPVLSVLSGNNDEVLIPFNEQFLISIDKKQKKIIFNLPAGLTDINK